MKDIGARMNDLFEKGELCNLNHKLALVYVFKPQKLRSQGMYHLPHYLAERTLFMFFAGLVIGAFTVIVLFAIVDIWAIKQDLDRKKEPVIFPDC
jgi:hypothetical protein